MTTWEDVNYTGQSFSYGRDVCQDDTVNLPAGFVCSFYYNTKDYSTCNINTITMSSMLTWLLLLP